MLQASIAAPNFKLFNYEYLKIEKSLKADEKLYYCFSLRVLRTSWLHPTDWCYATKVSSEYRTE